MSDHLRRRSTLVQRMLEVRRQRLIQLRSDGTIGDEAFHALEEELDISELSMVIRQRL